MLDASEGMADLATAPQPHLRHVKFPKFVDATNSNNNTSRMKISHQKLLRLYV